MTNIRAIAAADLPVLAELHARSFPEPWNEKALDDLLTSSGVMGLIAESNLGFILIRAVADEAEILTICVADAARQGGVGRALLQAGAAKATDAGIKEMFLEVVTDNEAAKALYNRCGFREVGTRKAYYQGKDARIMRAALPLALANAKKTL